MCVEFSTRPEGWLMGYFSPVGGKGKTMKSLIARREARSVAADIPLRPVTGRHTGGNAQRLIRVV
jgi:hypothetical protein